MNRPGSGSVTYLTRDAGIRQFLDIGTGLPTRPNVHELAQAIAPTSRIVYVDNDPLVLVHARALLTSGPHRRTDYADAELCDPDRIIEATQLTGVLDLSEPVALGWFAVDVPDQRGDSDQIDDLRLAGASQPDPGRGSCRWRWAERAIYT